MTSRDPERSRSWPKYIWMQDAMFFNLILF